MSRIKIDIPDHFPFYTELEVRITDINYGGHVGNDRFLVYIQEARQQFLASKGYTELNVAGNGLIMADAAIRFKREILYGQSLVIGVLANDFDRMSFDLVYGIFIKEKDGSKVLAGAAKTNMVYYNYSTHKKVSLSQDVIATLSQT